MARERNRIQMHGVPVPATRNGKSRPQITHSFRVQDAFGIPLESTEDFVWLSNTVKCRRHTLTGVPAKRVDVLVADPVYGQDYVLQIHRKTGRYDGSERDQLVFRPYMKAQCSEWEFVTVVVEMDESKLKITAGNWSAEYGRLKSTMDGYELDRIVMWHWTRYYRFIPRDEAEQAADYFKVVCNSQTLAEANRAASRLLYDLARNLGWRKLTLREQLKSGVQGQWHRQERLGTKTGCSEHTEREAKGIRPLD